MSFYRRTTPRTDVPVAEDAAVSTGADREGLVARMLRLWVEYNERVVQYRLLDK